MEKHKTFIVKLAIGAFLALLVCTVMARSVYTWLLPTVEAVVASSGPLTYRSVFPGTFSSNVNREKVSALDSWVIKEVVASQGQTVNTGDILFKIDISNYQIQLSQLSAQIQQQKNEINATNWTGGDRLVKNEQLRTLELEYSQLQKKFPARGLVLAPAAGTVSLEVETGAVAVGQTLASIVTSAGSSSVKWDVPAQDVLAFRTPDSVIACEYTLPGASGGVQKMSETLSIANIEYDRQSNSYRIEAGLAAELLPFDGTPVTVVVESQSPDYNALVPINCIVHDANSTYIMLVQQRNTIWGVEDFVIKYPLQVLESNYKYAAVSGGGLFDQRIAAYPSRTLVDQETVRVNSQ